jgi:hypothetical protein
MLVENEIIIPFRRPVRDGMCKEKYPFFIGKKKNAMKRILCILCIIGVAFTAGAQTTSPNIRYVMETAAGDSTGSDWANASADLQKMIDLSGAGDQVWVAAGTYLPLYTASNTNNTNDSLPSNCLLRPTSTDLHPSSTPCPRTTPSPYNSFVMKAGVKLYGGFSASDPETDINQRATYTYAPGITQMTHKSILSGENGNSTSGHVIHVVIFAGEMIAGQDTARLDGFTVTGGYAGSSAPGEHNTFVNNIEIEKTCGGGIIINFGKGNNESSVVIVNDSIAGNQCDFAGSNNPASGGGVFIANGKPSFSSTIISENTARTDGGGISNGGSSTFTNMLVSGNSATSGGGIYNSNSSISSSSSKSTYTNILVSGNKAVTGGGIYNSNIAATFTNILVSGNSATTGGGIYDLGVLASSNTTYINATIAGNYGSGLTNIRNNNNLKLYNTIIWGNSNPGNGITDAPLEGNIQNSLIQGFTPRAGDLNNLDNTVDPLFVNPVDPSLVPTTEGDYRLQGISPVIDKGNSALYTSGIPVDLNGNPRIIHIIDLGAYESTIIALGDTVMNVADSIEIDVLANDDRGAYTKTALSSFRIAAPPQHGTATINSDSMLVYTHTSGYYGIDSVDYTIRCNSDSSTARVYILTLNLVDTLCATCIGSNITVGFLSASITTDNPLYSYAWYKVDGHLIVDSVRSTIEFTKTAALIDTLYVAAIYNNNMIQTPKYSIAVSILKPLVFGPLSADPLSPDPLSADQTICYNTAPSPLTIKEPEGGTGTNIYQWQQKTEDADDWEDVTTDGADLIYTPGKLTVTTMYRLIATSDCVGDTSDVITINVSRLATAGMIMVNAPYEVSCYGQRASLTASCDILNPVFRWYASQESADILYTGDTFTTPLITVDTAYYVSVSGDTTCENAKCDRQRVTVTIDPTKSESVFVDDIWYFGANHQGIRFTKNSNGVYTAVSASNESKVDSRENSLVVSSPYCDGQNIFYASHNELFNSLHEKMGDFMGNSSVADGLAACYMGWNKYLLFSVTNANEVMYDGGQGKKGLKAYVIDMNADYGRGAIVDSMEIVKPNTLMSESIELVAADNTEHTYWLIYAYDHKLYVRSVNVNLYSMPEEKIVSDEDDTQTINLSATGTTYTLKASPQHDRIAIANADDKTVEVFDFNNATGVLSNPRTTPSHQVDGIAYGVEFSPDGNQLYAAGYTTASGTPKLCQYTITPTELVHVDDIVYWTYTGTEGSARGGGLKLGPDGKIYVMLDYDTHVGVVSEPNDTTSLDGDDGRYEVDAFDLDLGIDKDLHYTLQFSTGITRPSEMECNTNVAPTTVADSAILCHSNESGTTKVNVLVNDWDSDSDTIYLTGAEFVHVSDTALAFIAVNPADSTVSLTIKPDVYHSVFGYVFEILYHVKDDGTPASRCATGNLKIMAYHTPHYPDIRVRVCPNAGPVDLSKYLDTLVDVSSSVSWTSLTPAGISINPNTGVCLTDNSITVGTYTFAYTVSNSCVSAQRSKIYLEALRSGRMHPLKDSVVICYRYAEALQLNQLFGIEGGGSWKFIFDGVTQTQTPSPPYISTLTSGAVIMNGAAIYETLGVKRIEVVYKRGSGSCLSEASYPITIVLTEQ